LSFKAAAWAIECCSVENTNQKMVLIVLADCHNSETGRCDPSIEFIAERALMSRRTVERCLTRLETLGLLVRKQRADSNGFKTSNAYSLSIKHASESRIDATERQETATERMRQRVATDASESRNGCVTQSVSDASHSRINQEYLNQEYTHTGRGENLRICPVDFEPEPGWEHRAEIPSGVCWETELKRFKNHEFQTTRSDWQRAWLNWIQRARPLPTQTTRLGVSQSDYVEAMLQSPTGGV
jgi:hypothetical protein